MSGSDFNGDGRDDVIWRNASGTMIEWLGQADGSFAWNAQSIYQMPTNWQILGFGDFNGDARDDILWRSEAGTIVQWLGQDTGLFAYNMLANNAQALAWQIFGPGDFNGDTRDDILWRSDTGAITEWLGQADGSFSNNPAALAQVSNDLQIAATGDFNGDGRDEIVWRSISTGATFARLASPDGSFSPDPSASYLMPSNWQVAGSGDFNGDGQSDLLWRENASGSIIEWLGQADGTFAYNAAANASVSVAWILWDTGDYNGDGRDDLLLRNPASGVVTDYIAQSDGSFLPNNAASYALPTSWFFQPNLSGAGYWDY